MADVRDCDIDDIGVGFMSDPINDSSVTLIHLIQGSIDDTPIVEVILTFTARASTLDVRIYAGIDFRRQNLTSVDVIF